MKKKQQEIKEDIERYKQLLKQETDYEQREFLISGIKNLMKWPPDWISELESIDNISMRKMTKRIAMPPENIRAGFNSPHTHKDLAKRIYVGFKFG